MDEAGEHYSKGNKPDTEWQILYDLPYTWHKKQTNTTQQQTNPPNPNS